MKRFFITAFLICGAGFCLAQETDSLTLTSVDSLNLSLVNITDSIDILGLVQIQIKEAMDRQLKGEIKSSINFIYAEKELIEVAPLKEISQSSSLDEIIKEVVENKLLLLGAFSIFVFSVTFIRRKTSHKSDLFKKELEEKVTATGKENYSVQNNPELNLIRSKLMNTPDYELVEKSVSAKAKELHIAKGEVILAARLKSYQLAELSLNNK